MEPELIDHPTLCRPSLSEPSTKTRVFQILKQTFSTFVTREHIEDGGIAYDVYFFYLSQKIRQNNGFTKLLAKFFVHFYVFKAKSTILTNSSFS